MSAGEKTGLLACVEELRSFVREATKGPFKFNHRNELHPHRENTNKNDTAISVQQAYDEYVRVANALSHEFIEVTGKDGKSFKLSIFTPEKTPAPADGRPCLFFIHGGGLVTNNAFSGISSIFPCIDGLNAVCVSIEYSLAPESKSPTQVEQCYEGLKALWNNYKGLKKINFDKLAIIGRSAGAALLVGLNMKILKDPEIKIKCNIMTYPMLDHKCDTNSHKEFCDAPHLPGETAKFFWAQYLENGGEVSGLTVPALATIEDLKGFPPTLVEKANADVLRDEAQKFQENLKAAGVDAHILQYAGYHCFDNAATTNIANEAKQKRLEFLKAKQMA